MVVSTCGGISTDTILLNTDGSEVMLRLDAFEAVIKDGGAVRSHECRCDRQRAPSCPVYSTWRLVVAAAHAWSGRQPRRPRAGLVRGHGGRYHGPRRAEIRAKKLACPGLPLRRLQRSARSSEGLGHLGRSAGEAGHYDLCNSGGRVPHPTCDVVKGHGHAGRTGGPREVWCHGGEDHGAHAVCGVCSGYGERCSELGQGAPLRAAPRGGHQHRHKVAPHRTRQVAC